MKRDTARLILRNITLWIKDKPEENVFTYIEDLNTFEISRSHLTNNVDVIKAFIDDFSILKTTNIGKENWTPISDDLPIEDSLYRYKIGSPKKRKYKDDSMPELEQYLTIINNLKDKSKGMMILSAGDYANLMRHAVLHYMQKSELDIHYTTHPFISICGVKLIISNSVSDGEMTLVRRV